MVFAIKRVYEPATPDDGFRVLVDRLWPRGVSRERAELDRWDTQISPSPGLRTGWNHDPARFDEFALRYRAELDSGAAAPELLARGRDHARITLLYGARDPHVNHAIVLLDWLGAHGAEIERPG